MKTTLIDVNAYEVNNVCNVEILAFWEATDMLKQVSKEM